MNSIKTAVYGVVYSSKPEITLIKQSLNWSLRLNTWRGLECQVLVNSTAKSICTSKDSVREINILSIFFNIRARLINIAVVAEEAG